MINLYTGCKTVADEVFRNQAIDWWKDLISTYRGELRAFTLIKKYNQNINNNLSSITGTQIEFIYCAQYTIVGYDELGQPLNAAGEIVTNPIQQKKMYTREDVLKIIDHCWGYKNESIRTKEEWIKQNL